MDFQRLLLFLALSFVLVLLWQAWQEDYGPQPPMTQAQAPAPSEPAPQAGADLPTRPGETKDGTASVAPADVLPSAQEVEVTTDVLHVVIDTAGGSIRRADLPAYPVSLEKPDEPTPLLTDRDGQVFVAQSGLRAADSGPSPDHHAVYRAEATDYRLEPDAEQLEVRLTWRSEEGVEVDKVFTFRRGHYLVDVRYDIRNKGQSPWAGYPYRQLQRNAPTGGRSAFGIYTYTGGVIYTPENKYEKIDFDDIAEKNLDRTAEGGWAAMIQHYFLAAWVPPQDQTQHYYSKALGGDRYLLGMIAPAVQVPAGGSATLGSSFYVGPKLQHRLEAIAPGLELTVDYGVLTVIAKPIYWLLEKIHSLVGNWGWSIVLLTLLIKLLFYKPSQLSYKSMAQMRKMQPRMQSLKERYGDDRQKMQEAMMRIYKEEKINPLNGCLPILIQIPVFIALYWVLLESVELRQAPFILWIQDLSRADPYFVLPVLMGASMIVQHRLNPTPMDPIQAKVMMALPVLFTIFFAFFPAGLVLYWVVNNVLSITQQWYITRQVAGT